MITIDFLKPHLKIIEGGRFQWVSQSIVINITEKMVPVEKTSVTYFHKNNRIETINRSRVLEDKPKAPSNVILSECEEDGRRREYEEEKEEIIKDRIKRYPPICNR